MGTLLSKPAALQQGDFRLRMIVMPLYLLCFKDARDAPVLQQCVASFTVLQEPTKYLLKMQDVLPTSAKHWRSDCGVHAVQPSTQAVSQQGLLLASDSCGRSGRQCGHV